MTVSSGNLKKLVKIGGKQYKIGELTNKEILSLIISRMEDIEDMVRSLDDRERLLQKQMAVLQTKLDDYKREQEEKEKSKQRSKEDYKWIVAMAVTILLSVASMVASLWR